MTSGPEAFANGKDEQKQDQAEREILKGLVLGFAKSFVLKAVVDLRIPDILARAGGQLTLDEIAAQLPSETVQMDYLDRIMTYSTLDDLFTELSEGENIRQGQKRFGLTALSFHLVAEEEAVADPKTSLVPWVRCHLSKYSQEPWHNFSAAVLSGTDPFRLAHGQDMWKSCASEPEWGKGFNKMMTSSTFGITRAVVKGYKGFRGVKQLVDVGGGVGAALATVTQAYPDITGILFDLPHVIAQAPQIAGVRHVAGDMFKSVPEGDAIMLKWILHDWSDEECTHILENCHKSLPQDGKVIIVEGVLSNPKNTPDYTMDMIMLAFTSAGRERTAPQWHRLLQGAGFQRVEFIALPLTHVIEGHKL